MLFKSILHWWKQLFVIISILITGFILILYRQSVPNGPKMGIQNFTDFQNTTVQYPQSSKEVDYSRRDERIEEESYKYNFSSNSSTQNIFQSFSKTGEKSSKTECMSRHNALWSQRTGILENSTGPACSAMMKSSKISWNKEYLSLIRMSRRWTPSNAHNDTSLMDMLKDCSQFREFLKFPTKPLSTEEAQYPLAYVFMAHRNAAQTVRLFRMIYQPQNVYCIAYDTKSNQDYIKTILAMASCFPSNVFLNPKPEKINYGEYSILRSVMNCMKVLHHSSVNWKYVQVVSWNDFPLRTNLEMVRIFKILNGSQDCELIGPEQFTPDFYIYKRSSDRIRKTVPPGGVTMYKGSFATTVSRDFINFMFTNPISIKLYKYLNDTNCPEEYYWPTLIHNIYLNSPGGFPGQCQIFYTNANEKKPFISRYQVWKWDLPERRCRGEIVSFSCVYGVWDIGQLIERMELIAHKMYEEYQPALLYCLEEWYWQKVCNADDQLNFAYYEQLPSVKYHALSDEQKKKYVCKL